MLGLKSIQILCVCDDLSVLNRLCEEAENHARTLRQTEEHYRSRLVEMQEEKTLALEEKELHCTSLISREQNNQQGLQVNSHF